MKNCKLTAILFLAAFVLMLVVSCKVTSKVTDTAPTNEVEFSSPKIAFITCVIVNDTIKHEYRIRLVSKIIADGNVKEREVKPFLPKTNDLEYAVLNASSKALTRTYFANPLNRTVEFVDNIGQLAKKEISLDSTQFSLRIPLDPKAKFVSFEKYNGINSDNTNLLIIDLLKN